MHDTITQKLYFRQLLDISLECVPTTIDSKGLICTHKSIKALYI